MAVKDTNGGPNGDAGELAGDRCPSHADATMEGLERRRMMDGSSVSGGVATVYGDNNADAVTVAVTATQATVTIDSYQSQWPIGTGTGEITHPVVLTYGGTDGTSFVPLTVQSAIEGFVEMHLGDGNDYVTLSGQGSVVHGDAGNDTVNGSAGDDTIYGDADADYVHGNAGDDHIEGGTGEDFLYGDANEDWISGGAGNDDTRGGNDGDVLWGDSGKDKLWGEGAYDFIFAQDGELDGVYGGADSDDYIQSDAIDDVTP